MKALSIRQPWAWMVVSGLKTVENRSRNTNQRGRVLVHASQTIDMSEKNYRQMRREFQGIGVLIPAYDELLTGGIIGSVEIVDSTYYPDDENDRDWHEPDACAWILRNAEMLPFRPFKGKLNFFEVPDDIN